jgi:hypothetical protein
MNVGISLLAAPGAHIRGGGIHQDLAFLVLLLRQCQEIDRIYLIDATAAAGGGALPAGMAEALGATAVVRPADITYQVDCVIEMDARLPVEWLRRVRALGARLVLFMPGHAFASAAEGPVFGRRGLDFSDAPWHEIWMLPQHMHAGASLMRTLARVPVAAVPPLWSPVFVDQQITALAAGGLRFGLNMEKRARHAGWRVGIFEPNLSVVNNCSLPMLACEHAYRSDRESVETMMVMNAVHMKGHPSFNSMAGGLDLTRDSRASYEPPLGFAECMATQGLDAVVSHQWEGGPDALHFEALYGGYALVHNSDVLARQGVGLHYPGFEARAAGEALLRARRLEPGFWSGHAARVKTFLHALAPDHPANIKAFRARMWAGKETSP